MSIICSFLKALPCLFIPFAMSVQTAGGPLFVNLSRLFQVVRHDSVEQILLISRILQGMPKLPLKFSRHPVAGRPNLSLKNFPRPRTATRGKGQRSFKNLPKRLSGDERKLVEELSKLNKVKAPNATNAVDTWSEIIATE